MSVDEKEVVLGIIGGSGVYQMESADVIKIIREHKIDTPFGAPSDLIVEADIEGRHVFFLPRHGKGHRLLPAEVPYRANVFALKQLGVTQVMAVSAVGIMQDHIKPGDMVCPDQIFDRTKGVRDSTFFGNGCAGHVTFADPFCDCIRDSIATGAKMASATIHSGGAYVCMEGPQFSTRAESNFYRKTLKPAVIGMTAIPEAKLCREAEMCYGMLALATDYDCWHESEEEVSVEAVLAVLKSNSELANTIVVNVAKSVPKTRKCECHQAAMFATITSPDMISDDARKRLSPLYGKYWNR